MRRKILRLYWGDMLLLPADYWMGVLAWVGRETQDFASLQGGYAAIVSGLLNGCIGVGRT